MLKPEIESPAFFAVSILSYDLGSMNLEISRKGRIPGMELLFVPAQIITKAFGFQMTVHSTAVDLSS